MREHFRPSLIAIGGGAGHFGAGGCYRLSFVLFFLNGALVLLAWSWVLKRVRRMLGVPAPNCKFLQQHNTQHGGRLPTPADR